MSVDPRPAGFGIYTVEASTGEPATEITGHEEGWEHFESRLRLRTGGRWRFWRPGGGISNIILRDLRTGTHSAVLTDPPLNAWPFVNLEYSPDGKRLLFVSGHDYVVDVPRM